MPSTLPCFWLASRIASKNLFWSTNQSNARWCRYKFLACLVTKSFKSCGGLTRLEMTASDSAVKQISKLAQGLPHYAHLLGLHSVRAALAKSTDEVGVVAVREAIDTSIKNSSMSIRTAYETAIRSARKENLFSDVLLACALAPTSDLGVFAAQDLRDPLKTITKKRYEIPTYAQHLNEFCMPKRGPILQKTGTSRLYRYRFVNPLMQPFVIMKGLQANRIESSILE